MSEPTSTSSTTHDQPSFSFSDYVRLGVDIVRLRPAAIDRAVERDRAVSRGLIIVAIAGAVASFGFVRPVLFLPAAIAAVTLFLLFSTMIWLCATRMVGGHGALGTLAAPLALATVLFWTAIIPFLGVLLLGLGFLWYLAVAVLCAERVYGIDRGQAILAVLLPATAICLVAVFVVVGVLLMISMWLAF